MDDFLRLPFVGNALALCVPAHMQYAVQIDEGRSGDF